MVRTRMTSLVLAGSLALSAGCQNSLCERPLLGRFFGNGQSESCCPDQGELIYDGPALPDNGGPLLPGSTLTPPTPLTSPPPPAAGTPPPPLRPQAQPQPYTPSQVRR